MLDDRAEYRMKVQKLMVEFQNDRLPDNDFINSFLPRVWEKVKAGRELSEKEKAKVDELFDKN